MGSLAVCCGLLGSSLAHADPFGEREHGARREERNAAPAREVQHAAQPASAAAVAPAQHAADPRQFDTRSFEARAEEQRRAMEAAGHSADAGRRAGRLTPDERRDLRRQINEVGQDLYANPPHHR